jgi:hypothetical protein
VEQGSLRLLPLADLPCLITCIRHTLCGAAVEQSSLRLLLAELPVSLPEYNRHIAAHLVEQGSLRLLLLAELPRLIALLRPALIDGAAELRNLFLQPLDLCAIGRELLHSLKDKSLNPIKYAVA